MRYIETVLDRFGMSESKGVETPMNPGEKMSRKMCPTTEKEKSEMAAVPYQSALGSVMYAMLGTRPDIAYAVGVLSRYASNPGKHHWIAMKRLLRYLKQTKTRCLSLGGNKVELVGYSDADWAGDTDDRKSTSGYVFKIGRGAVSWGSKKQATVSLSSTEAEYIAISEATKEAIWLRRLLIDFGAECKAPTIVYEDNQGCILLTRNPEFHARTKHIEIRYHFCLERVESGEIDVKYLDTSKMVADVLTKSLSRLKHEEFIKMMGVEESSFISASGGVAGAACAVRWHVPLHTAMCGVANQVPNCFSRQSMAKVALP
jgi:hypothetical protein